MMQNDSNEFDEPPEDEPMKENAAMPFFDDVEQKAQAGEDSNAIDEVRRKYESTLLSVEGVEGVSVEIGEIGEFVIVVFVRDQEVILRIPKELEGFQVRAEVTGEFDALSDQSGEEVTLDHGETKKKKETQKTIRKKRPKKTKG